MVNYLFSEYYLSVFQKLWKANPTRVTRLKVAPNMADPAVRNTQSVASITSLIWKKNLRQSKRGTRKKQSSLEKQNIPNKVFTSYLRQFIFFVILVQAGIYDPELDGILNQLYVVYILACIMFIFKIIACIFVFSGISQVIANDQRS